MVNCTSQRTIFEKKKSVNIGITIFWVPIRVLLSVSHPTNSPLIIQGLISIFEELMIEILTFV